MFSWIHSFMVGQSLTTVPIFPFWKTPCTCYKLEERANMFSRAYLCQEANTNPIKKKHGFKLPCMVVEQIPMFVIVEDLSSPDIPLSGGAVSYSQRYNPQRSSLLLSTALVDSTIWGVSPHSLALVYSALWGCVFPLICPH